MVATHPTSAGWVLTAFFYSALHFSEAYLNKISVAPKNHSERTDQIKRLPELAKIYTHYRHLSDLGYNTTFTFTEKKTFRRRFPPWKRSSATSGPCCFSHSIAIALALPTAILPPTFTPTVTGIRGPAGQPAGI